MNRSLLGKIGRHLGHRAAGIRSGVLTVAGLGCLVAAGWEHSTWAGYTATALALLAIDWFWSADRPDGARR